MNNFMWRLTTAPMIDVTDRHCRYFFRLLAPNALLYTEMITTGALKFGDIPRHLQFNEQEHPVALQLGGSDPSDLADCAKLGQDWGYDEINLNCGCPSERVQKGSFGACLMAEPALVAECVKAMQDKVSIPVTVKHRLGLDYNESYSFVQDFVGQLVEVGCTVFVTHARNAVLKGLSPKDNREIPPLRYEVVSQLQKDFPQAKFILNGGLSDLQPMQEQLERFDGIMLGRSAWHTPGVLREVHRYLWPDISLPTNEEVFQKMFEYGQKQVALGVPLRLITKPMLGLVHAQKGARVWRRVLSDAKLLADNDPGLILKAAEILA